MQKAGTVGCRRGKAVSYLSDLLLEKGYKGHVRSLGIKDPMIRCGTLDEQYRQAGLDPDSIADNVLDVLNKR